MFCTKCGEAIADGSNVCPVCNSSLNDENDSGRALVYASQKNIEAVIGNEKQRIIDPEKMKRNKIISILLCVIGAVLLISAIRPITTAKYKHYVDNCDYYISQYKETSSMAGGGILGSGYASLASRWKEMADEAKKHIWTNRVVSIMLVASGATIIIVGAKKIKKNKPIDNKKGDVE